MQKLKIKYPEMINTNLGMKLYTHVICDTRHLSAYFSKNYKKINVKKCEKNLQNLLLGYRAAFCICMQWHLP
jgi:hypothetical protein